MGSPPARVAIASLLVAGFALGCSSSLRVFRLEETAHQLSQGVVYYLPKVEFDISLRRELRRCDPVKRTIILQQSLRERSKPKEVATILYGAISLEVATTALVTPRYVADRREAYVIEYESLNAPLKKGSIEIELYNHGGLKSINGEVEDRTKEALAGVVRGITEVARLAIAPTLRPPLPVAFTYFREPEETLPLCTQLVTAALEKSAKVAEDIRRTEAAIRQKDEAIAMTVEAIRAAGANAPRDLFAKLEELKTKLKEDTRRLEDLKQELDTVKKALIHVQEYVVVPEFIPGGPLFTTERLSLSTEVGLRWFDQGTIAELSGKPRLPAARSADFVAEFPLKDKLDPRGTYPAELDGVANVVVGRSARREVAAMPAGTLSGPGAGNAGKNGGVVYRQPVHGELMICPGRSCVSQDGAPEVPAGSRMFSKAFLIPQAGVRSTLPLKNKAFDATTIFAAFDESGALLKLKYTTAAEAEKAAAAFADTAEALTKVRREAAKAETEMIEVETKRLEALKKKAEAERALKRVLEDAR